MRGSQPWRTNRSRVLRSQPISAEAKLWAKLRNRQRQLRVNFPSRECLAVTAVAPLSYGKSLVDQSVTVECHKRLPRDKKERGRVAHLARQLRRSIAMPNVDSSSSRLGSVARSGRSLHYARRPRHPNLDEGCARKLVWRLGFLQKASFVQSAIGAIAPGPLRGAKD